MPHKFYITDVFAEEMQKIALSFNFAETTFITGSANGCLAFLRYRPEFCDLKSLASTCPYQFDGIVSGGIFDTMSGLKQSRENNHE